MSGRGMDHAASPGRPRCSIHEAELGSTGECPICSELIAPSVKVFDEGNDEGYRTWIAQHRGGYVINIQKSFNPTDARVHQATCHDINDEPARGETFVGDYVKVCAVRRIHLDEWEKTTLGTTVEECRNCF
jgi:hypothetical protein